MRPRNIIKHCAEGWIVGLSDHNNILVQAPNGEIGVPSDISGDAVVTFSGEETAPMPPDVIEIVAELWQRQSRIEQAQEKEALTEVPVEEDGEEPPTLAEMGFADNPRVD